MTAVEQMEWGRIVNVSSLASYVPLPLSGHYVACKAAVNVGEAVVFLTSDASRWVTGQTLTISGGLTSL